MISVEGTDISEVVSVGVGGGTERGIKERQMTKRKCPGQDTWSSVFSFLLEWFKKVKESRAPVIPIKPGQPSSLHCKKISHAGVLGSQQAKLRSKNERLSIKNGSVQRDHLWISHSFYR